MDANIYGVGKEASEFSFNEGTAKSGVDLDISNDSTHGPGRIENVVITGFGMGTALPVNSRWEINNMQLHNNRTDMLFIEPENDTTALLFNNLSYQSFMIHEQPDATELPGYVVVRNSQ